MFMEFEWNEDKSNRCFLERGFDFAYVLKAFFDEHKLISEDKRFDYGEQRYQLIGQIEGRHFFVVFTLREGVRRIISARKANKREVRIYENR